MSLHLLRAWRSGKFPSTWSCRTSARGGLAEVSFTVPQDDLAETLTAAEHAVAQLGRGTRAARHERVESLGRRQRNADAHRRRGPDVPIAVATRESTSAWSPPAKSRSRCWSTASACDDGRPGRARGIRPAPDRRRRRLGRLGAADAKAPSAEPLATNSSATSSPGCRRWKTLSSARCALDDEQSRVTIANLPDVAGRRRRSLLGGRRRGRDGRHDRAERQPQRPGASCRSPCRATTSNNACC